MHEAPDRPWLRLAVLPFVAVALAIAAHLWLNAGRPVIGCGPDGGCDAVLGSRWSRWFGLPVSGLATLLYAATIVLVPLSSRWPWAWAALRAAAVVIVGAAAWMMGLQAIVLRQFCPWCVAIHGVGMIAAALILVLGPRPWRPGWRPIFLAGAAGVAAVIGGTASSPSPPPLIEPRPLSILQGRVELDLAALPFMGTLDARHVGVLLYDYTCPQCRFLHGLLGRCLLRYGEEQLSFTLVPVPLDSRCNPSVSSTYVAREGACEYARLALAVWLAQPERFEEFDRFLTEKSSPPSQEDAAARAGEIVGAASLTKLLAGGPGNGPSRVDALLARGTKLYEQSGGGPLPKLIFNSVVMAGQPASMQRFRELLEEHLGIVAKD